MKQKNNFRLKTLFLISALFIFSIALALQSNAKAGEAIDCNLTMPTMQVGTEGNVTYNTSSGTDYDIPSVSAAIFVRSPSTANSTDSLIINTTNSSNRNHINFTFTRGLDNLEDSNDYTAYAICYLNGTASSGSLADRYGNSTALTGRIIDLGGIPAVPTSISPTGKNITSKDHTFIATVQGANTTQCTLTFIGKNPGQSAYSMTHSGDTCSQSINDIAESLYEFTITASDGTNSSVTALQSLTIDLPSSAGRKAKIFNAFGGGGRSQESIGKGLAIAQSTRAGEVSQGLANVQVQINQFVQKESQPKELTKTGIGLGAGIAIGVLVPTLIIPGVGLITAPVLGGLIGAGIGVAI